MTEQIVVFRLGAQRFGLDIRFVHEVVSWIEPTPIPGAPDAVQGVLSLRQRVVPVMDLGRRFGVQRQRTAQDARIMVVEINDQLVGLVVDDVSEVMRLVPEMVEPPAPVIRNARDPVIRGVVRQEDNSLIVLLDEAGVVGDATAMGAAAAVGATAAVAAATASARTGASGEGAA